MRQRKQLYDRFRSEQLAFNEQLHRQSEEERVRRDQYRAAREAKRKIRYAYNLLCMAFRTQLFKAFPHVFARTG